MERDRSLIDLPSAEMGTAHRENKMSFDNNVQIVGNLGSEPETRHFESGAKLSALSVALYAGKDKPAVWVKVKAWNEVVESMPQGLKKGDRVCVIGQLSAPEAWLSKVDNSAKCSIVVNAEAIALKPWSDRSGGKASQPAPANSDEGRPVENYDEIPF